MAMAILSWLIAIPLLGFSTGLRTMTPIAVLCWFAVLGHLPVHGTWAFWTAKLISALIFTALALAEYIGDKLPSTPARTDLFPLIARLSFGALVGALVATALIGSAVEGALLGTAGAALGAFAGFHLRTCAVIRSWGWPDWRVAIIEDAVALLASIIALSVVTG